LIYASQRQNRDARHPDEILRRAHLEDQYAWKKMREGSHYTLAMYKEQQRMLEEKLMPKSLKDAAKLVDDNLAKLEAGQHGDLVITRSPKLAKQD
jgi:hypothetical protein